MHYTRFQAFVSVTNGVKLLEFQQRPNFMCIILMHQRRTGGNQEFRKIWYMVYDFISLCTIKFPNIRDR